MWTIAVDAMGGDHAPQAIIEGTVTALQQHQDIRIVMLGIESEIRKHLSNDERITIIDTPEVIETGEDPLLAIRRKKNSSLIKGLELLKSKEADAFISAGSTGAVLTGAFFKVGRIKGIDRPALAPVMPSKTGKVMLIDCGANPDCEPKFLQQFAIMGSAYMELVEGVDNPKVGLLNNGAEEAKGSKLYKQVNKDLHAMESINYYGNIEARYGMSGEVDVLVCDGFAGNVFLKAVEGTAKFIMSELKDEILKNPIRKLGAGLMKPGLKALKSKLNYKDYGGAAFLGIEGCVIKAHGSSDATSFTAAIQQGVNYLEKDVTNSIRAKVQENL